MAPPHRADKLGEERFDSEGVAAAITAAGKQGFAPASNDALLAELTARVKSDPSPRCVIFFSNGAFGGIIKSSPSRSELTLQAERFPGLRRIEHDLRLQGGEVGELLFGAEAAYPANADGIARGRRGAS